MKTFLIGAGVIAAAAFWGWPVLKSAFNLGDSYLVKYEVTSAEDVPDVEFKKGEEVTMVPRTVVGIVINFPMGSAPETINELSIEDDDGHPIDVIWQGVDKRDMEDLRVTRISAKLFLPMGFRQGRLKNKLRELAYIRLPKVPYNVD